MPPRTANKCVANRSQSSLFETGPILPVFITIPDIVAKARGGDHPVVKVNALLDTGAHSTCVTARVANDLNLRPIGTCMVGGAYGHPEERNLYSISFTFEGSDFQLPGVQVSEADLHGSPFDMLVGRDVLGFCHFTYDGHTGQYTLEVPSPNSPDHPRNAAQRKREVQETQIEKKKLKNRQRSRMARTARTRNR